MWINADVILCRLNCAISIFLTASDGGSKVICNKVNGIKKEGLTTPLNWNQRSLKYALSEGELKVNTAGVNDNGSKGSKGFEFAKSFFFK